MITRIFPFVFAAIFFPLYLMGQALDTLILGPSIKLERDSTAHIIVVCPNGYHVVAGGWDGSGGSNQLFVSRSFPSNNGLLNQWQFTFNHSGFGDAITVYTYVLCKRVVPTSVLQTDPELPMQLKLSQNYPNPFNPSTTFDYSINTRSAVRIEVFNEAGQLINTLVEGMMETGNYQISWNGKSSSGTGVSSGVYFYRLTSDGLIQTKKMILIK
jgi:hypothetical protein